MDFEYPQVDEIEIRSTRGQWEDFVEGTIWQDLKTYLLMLRGAVRDELEDCPMGEVKKFQGRAEILRDIVLLPELIIESLELKSEEKEETDQEDDIFKDFNK